MPPLGKQAFFSPFTCESEVAEDGGLLQTHVCQAAIFFCTEQVEIIRMCIFHIKF